MKSALYHLICYATVFASCLPLLVIVIMSLRNSSGPVFTEGFGLGNYRLVLHEIPLSIKNSFMVSIASVTLLVTLGTIVGYALSKRRTRINKVLDYLLMVPFVIPGTVLGIGYITRFNTGPLILTGTSLILILVCSTRRLPYSVRSAAAIVRQIPESIEEASLCLGKSPLRTFWAVSLPLMQPGIIAGAILSFVMVINELSASAVLFTGGTLTMPVRIYQSVTNGDFGPAAALSTVLLLVCTVSILLINSLSHRSDAAWTG
jgi:iron(III) transport system permease protein